jgi:hypothetical protein
MAKLMVGDAFIVMPRRVGLGDRYHIVLDGAAASLCGKTFDSRDRWWIGVADGTLTAWCPHCLAGMDGEEAS